MNTKQSLGRDARMYASTFNGDDLDYNQSASAQDYSQGAVDMLNDIVNRMTQELAASGVLTYEEAKQFIIDTCFDEYRDLIKK